MSKFQIGQFVRSNDNYLGIGKIVNVEQQKISIEYFDSPAQEERFTLTATKSSITPEHLFPQTRVYYFDQISSFWRAGRILDNLGGAYIVRFPNKVTLEIKEEELYVRWNKSIRDPITYLETRNNETPYFHNGRADFVKSLMEQRNVSGGMNGLLSSCIELEEHQIEVVRRVLTDPIQRYLLADEVGLGKTIEAGIIIRQYILDHPTSHKVLIVVPVHLVEQWREELSSKFLLDIYLDYSIRIVPSDNLESIIDFGKDAKMLVIDEAHHIASFAGSKKRSERDLFLVIEEIAKRVEKFLMLSATPALHNEKSFLAMLHLLDPAIYSLDKVDEFRERIIKRQELAEIFHNFNKESPNFFLRNYAAELRGYFPHDNRLNTLLSAIEPFLEFGIPEDHPERIQLIKSVRSHISESYRLHRRMLRNRRTEELSMLVPGRCGLEIIKFKESVYNEIEELIEEWRIEASLHTQREKKGQDEQPMTALFQILLESFICDLQVLRRTLQIRLENEKIDLNTYPTGDVSIIQNAPRFHGEAKILKKILKIMDNNTAGEEQRLICLTKIIRNILNKSKKTVIFCNFNDTADYLCKILSPLFEQKLVRHTTGSNYSNESSPEWYQFKYNPDCSILVCDRQGEEGLNLQGGHAVILHYDLILSPNRLEQRLGRLDRYGTGDAVKSYALMYEDSIYLDKWIKCLNEALKLFDRSIACLQYLIEEEMKILWKNVLHDGIDALDSTINVFGGNDGKIEQELANIKKQDELDCIEIIENENDQWLDNLMEVDCEWQEKQKAMKTWLVDLLQYKLLFVGEQDKKVVRYQYNQHTLTPVTDLIGRFAEFVDRNVPHFDPSRPTTYALSYNRLTALKRKVRIARIGESFIDAMARYIRWDDRGICFAIWRYRPDVVIDDFVELFFRFDFIIETDIADVTKMVCKEQNVSPEVVVNVLQRKADALFPPIIQTLWIDENLEQVTAKEKLIYLEEPYRKELAMDYSRDYNLNPYRWELLEKMYDSVAWRQACESVKEAAHRKLREQINLVNLTGKHAKITKDKASVVLDQLQSRIASSTTIDKSYEQQQLSMEKSLSVAIIAGILKPKIRADSVGAIFLSNKNPFYSIKND